MTDRPRLTIVEPAQTSPAKARGRPFRPGNTIGRAGRPKGAKHRAYTVLDAIGVDAATEIVRSVVAQALAGDLAAARIILDRTWPAPKGRLVALPLPPINGVPDLAAAHAAVTTALAAGSITVDEAASVAALLEHRRRIIETSEIERRIAALERRSEHNGR